LIMQLSDIANPKALIAIFLFALQITLIIKAHNKLYRFTPPRLLYPIDLNDFSEDEDSDDE
jgi:hypothetical protein